ncbi:hypothetical protein LF41_1120 [Lysobacter dokdonensis DS-58]|uniref:Transporter n=1 Tax=Lysobacter dokdonensis DS-58 TaxID=1300345 RepID=A0A0A2WLB5_9GAMM|nr:transporter [Lysobacter dokdonensis]KGQ20583.1 hypothetical protein LF41_1120 [Lysobacter dokdonensis DS-58]
MASFGIPAIAVLALAGLASTARAQDIEPRAYSNAPIGVNFVIAGGIATRGGLSTDPAIPVTDAHLETRTLVVAYARVLDFGGRSGKFDVIVPYTHLDGSALYQGAPIERDVSGFGRPAFRVSINLLGAPSLSLPQFREWKQDLIVGASLQVSPPLGQYDDTRLVNIGTNRWTIEPEIGISKALGQWTLEGQAGVTLFTDNDDFYGGRTRSQQPLYSLQGHAIYGFRSGQWLSVDATWFTGGRTTVDGRLGNDLQQNWRMGVTFAIPVGRLNSIKLSASSGVSARTGNNFDAIGVAWQYRWGGGLR